LRYKLKKFGLIHSEEEETAAAPPVDGPPSR
jgi:hypothetical protein